MGLADRGLFQGYENENELYTKKEFLTVLIMQNDTQLSRIPTDDYPHGRFKLQRLHSMMKPGQIGTPFGSLQGTSFLPNFSQPFSLDSMDVIFQPLL